MHKRLVVDELLIVLGVRGVRRGAFRRSLPARLVAPLVLAGLAAWASPAGAGEKADEVIRLSGVKGGMCVHLVKKEKALDSYTPAIAAGPKGVCLVAYTGWEARQRRTVLQGRLGGSEGAARL